MDPRDKKAGRYYQLLKVHKDFTGKKIPDGRPIISGCGSITENLSLFEDTHTKNLVKTIPSYLQDTPDFLRQIEELKKEEIPENCFPISIDVVGLYNNIPHEEGIQCMKEALNEREDQTIPTLFLITLLTLTLTWNIFEFGLKTFIQLIGTAMGTRVAPTYANIFMMKIDTMIQGIAREMNNKLISFYKRFIDDIFIIWHGTEEDLKEFMTKINKAHPTIKFTVSYNIADRSTTFLDTKVSIKNGKISTTLYRKPTDRVQYLLPDSCHPSHVTSSIPYSLALRIVRICSERRKTS